MYTNEQLATLNVDQLRAAIQQLQGDQGVTAPVTQATPATAPDAEQAAVTATPIQTDIENMKTAIAQFETAGAKVFPDELAAMKQKLADMEAEAEAAVKEVGTDVKEVGAKLITAEQTFVQKYGSAIANGAEIILLAYIAGRLAGVL
jgi:hypothetical protein